MSVFNSSNKCKQKMRERLQIIYTTEIDLHLTIYYVFLKNYTRSDKRLKKNLQTCAIIVTRIEKIKIFLHHTICNNSSKIAIQ